MRSPVTSERILKLLKELGKSCRGPGSIYLAGGGSAVLIGWRETTIDVDLKFQPEPLGVFDRIPFLKDQLDLNIELAAPDDFVPALPEWKERSQWIASHNQVDFYHFDFYTQALSKLERDHAKDQLDVAAMVEAGLVLPSRLLELFDQLGSEQLNRYPSIEPASIRVAIVQLRDAHEH